MSMATKSSDIDDQISGANPPIEGCTLTSPSGQKGLEETGVSGSSPLPLPIPVSGEVTIAWSPKDLVLSRNMCNFNQRERSCTSATPCLDGTSGGGHAMTWQDWSHQSSSAGPGEGCPLLWEMVPRRPELRQGERHNIYTHRCR